MYKCLDCYEVFDEPKTYSEDRTPGEAFEGGSFNYEYDGCPHCSGAFAKAFECEHCGEWFLHHELIYDHDISEYVCEQCFDEINNI